MEESMSLQEKVVKMLAEKLELNPAEIPPDAHLIKDLGADSLDLVELVMAFEEEFDVEVPDEEAEKITTVREAIEHINRYGSGHTDAIVTTDETKADRFMALVDSANVLWNCSTRFSDGFRYNLGAEVGISTNKIHARGPVGLEGLLIYKWKLHGTGQIVADYSGPNAKKYTHRNM